MFQYNNNKRSVSDISQMFVAGKLKIDQTYQRRAIWVERDEFLLIETLLLGYIIPELFFWVAETNPDTGQQITHIVDGQQRINAIMKFVDNRLKLSKSYLENELIIAKYGNKTFNDLTPEEKNLVWNYQLNVIDIDSSATSEDIQEMFRRLNKTEYSLNAQERRNSLSGDFATLSYELSLLPIWGKYGLFRASDIKRMRDIEFCASLVLLYRDAIIDQTTQSALNKAYVDLQVDYDEKNSDKEAVLDAIDKLPILLNDKDSQKFAQRKSQLYTIFSVIFYAMRSEQEITEEVSQRLSKFVRLYDTFSNSNDIEENLLDGEKNIYDLLKKYKLASSEGVNKIINRKIRFDVMKTFLFSFVSKDYYELYDNLMKKMVILDEKHIEEDLNFDD